MGLLILVFVWGMDPQALVVVVKTETLRGPPEVGHMLVGYPLEAKVKPTETLKIGVVEERVAADQVGKVKGP